MKALSVTLAELLQIARQELIFLIEQRGCLMTVFRRRRAPFPKAMYLAVVAIAMIGWLWILYAMVVYLAS